MFGLSFSEIIIIIIVAILVLKPQDVKILWREVCKIYQYFLQLKKEILMPLVDEINNKFEEPNSLAENEGVKTEELNFYLEKIAAMGEQYTGEYSLQAIKNRYHQLVKIHLIQTKKQKEDNG